MVFALLDSRGFSFSDVEFFLNVGDWPVETRTPEEGAIPVFSWSGSTNSSDIVLPQWDVSKTSTLGFSKASSPDLLMFQVSLMKE